MGPSAQTQTDVHLVLLLHGLYGSSANLWCLEEEIASAHAASGSPLELHVLNATQYGGALTWDGIDVNAHRVADEVDQEIERLERAGKRVTAFSITGYSLGGLIARALIGELDQRTPSFFTRHRPASFCTIATPHLGVLRYGSWRSTWVHAVGQRLFSRTGQQLFCLDDHDECGRPLLSELADPESTYFAALSRFPRVVVIANGINDLTVPYPTAAIATHDPFIDHVHTALTIETDKRVVVRHYLPDPEEDEVEDALAPSRPRTPLSDSHLETGRPWLPPIFYTDWQGPLRYALFPILPLIVPAALTFVALTFAFHSFKSAQRIRLHSEERRRLLSNLVDPDTGTPVDSPRPSRPRTPNLSASKRSRLLHDNEEDENGGASTPPLAPSGRAASAGETPSDGIGRGTASQPLITPAQREMVRGFDSLPQLERVTAWFPGVFNAHAVIIARNGRNPRWGFQAWGRDVVRIWAGKVIAAVQDLDAHGVATS